MSLLLVKLTLAPALVVGSSLAGRRWGHEVSGLLVALPLVAGPILLITDLEHGARFASRAAAASLLGLVALASFVVVFARVSRRRHWPFAVAAGWLAFLAVALGFATLAPPAGAGLAIALCAYAIAPRLMPPDPHLESTSDAELPVWDLPARALATAVLVLGLTGAAAGLGPTLTGVLTPFPISNTVLAAFVLVLEGPAHANAFLRGFLRGAFGFVAFCFLLAVLLVPLGTAGAFALALCGALAAQLVARLLDRRASAVGASERLPGAERLVAAERAALVEAPVATAEARRRS
ncbi:MAG TPA: hypothetical protein VF706_01790 [Solirubrobacteraceae bacterium]